MVSTAGGLIDIGCDLPPERGVLDLQRLQLEETVSNTLRGALSKASFVPCSDPFLQHHVSDSFPQRSSKYLTQKYISHILIVSMRKVTYFCQGFFFSPFGKMTYLKTCSFLSSHQYTNPEAVLLIGVSGELITSFRIYVYIYIDVSLIIAVTPLDCVINVNIQ